jgi:cation diffusion facilitator CzcD-associated flavoprotein CzcO
MLNTLIIGASAAGLSCAAQLSRRHIAFDIVEQHPNVGQAWRNHYNRLHLHTHKSASNLPFINFPRGVAKYPSRQEVVQYLENYCQDQQIRAKFNTTVQRIERNNGTWATRTDKGDFLSKNVIICTGNTNRPKHVVKPGIDSFPGTIMHSSQYKNGKAFAGKHVLVIGFGNSACEIAICLHEHGAFPAMSVRSPVNVIPRDIMGIPVLQLGILLANLPPRLADNLNKPLMSLLVGDIEKYGLKKMSYGPMEQIARKRTVPLLDIGTMDLIKAGKVKVYGDIQSIEGDQIHFSKDSVHFDAIIMATGYETGLEKFISLDQQRLDDIRQSIKDRKLFGADNLYFCGFHVSPSGMLREIGLESKMIAEEIASESR